MDKQNDFSAGLLDFFEKNQLVIAFTCLALILAIAIGDFRNMSRKRGQGKGVLPSPAGSDTQKVGSLLFTRALCFFYNYYFLIITIFISMITFLMVLARCVEESSVPKGVKTVKAVIVA